MLHRVLRMLLRVLHALRVLHVLPMLRVLRVVTVLLHALLVLSHVALVLLHVQRVLVPVLLLPAGLVVRVHLLRVERVNRRLVFGRLHARVRAPRLCPGSRPRRARPRLYRLFEPRNQTTSAGGLGRSGAIRCGARAPASCGGWLERGILQGGFEGGKRGLAAEEIQQDGPGGSV